MRQPKFQIYEHIKISGKWRYFRASSGSQIVLLQLVTDCSSFPRFVVIKIVGRAWKIA